MADCQGSLKLEQKERLGQGNNRNGNPPWKGGWYWLLAPDGSHAVAGTKTKNDGGIDIPVVVDDGDDDDYTEDTTAKDCSGSNPKNDDESLVPMSTRSNTRDGTTRDSDSSRISAPDATAEETKPSDDPVAHPSGSSRWYWMLAPSGTPATAATTRPTTRRRTSRRRTARGSMATNEHRTRKNPTARGGWCWLLEADGTPATASLATRTRATTGKRKRCGRADEEDPEPPSGSREPRRRRRDSRYAEPIETGDEYTDADGNTSEENDDEDDDANRSFRESKFFRERWEKKFQLLVEYKNKHQTTNVPERHPELRQWVMTQRARYGSKTLRKWRRERLDSIGLVWDIRATEWMDMYHRLCSYKEKDNGSADVPKRFNNDKPLTQWVYTQRINYRCGKLSEKRISLLQSIGFQWQIKKNPGDDKAWMKMYQRLLSYKQKCKHTRVPILFASDRQLGTWANKQRSRCSTNQRRDLLNYIGFEWNAYKTDWMEMYQRLVAYRRKHKSTAVPSRLKSDPGLGAWVCTQRKFCKEKDRLDLLNEIGFVWSCI